MDATAAKHQAKLAQWRTRVAECRSSGMSVREWCAEQRIGYKTYYRWEREILQIAGKELVSASRKELAVPVFAELPTPPKQRGSIAEFFRNEKPTQGKRIEDCGNTAPAFPQITAASLPLLQELVSFCAIAEK